MSAENARTAQDQREYEERYNSLVAEYEEKWKRYEELTEQLGRERNHPGEGRYGRQVLG